MTLRQDIIVEKTRSTQEIRIQCAEQIRLYRRLLKARDYELAGLAHMRACLFKWVLRHDISCRDFYKAQYGREWPE